MPLKSEKPTDDALPVVQKVAPLATMQDVQPLDMQALFETAMAKGADGVEMLERLVKLKNGMDDRRAEAEFNLAKAKFHAECPPLIRRHENQQFSVTRNGATKHSWYCDLDDMCATIRDTLATNGLSYRWTDLVVKKDPDLGKDMLTLWCVLSHVGGHSESAPATYPIIAGEGQVTKKATMPQIYGSVQTYARRSSLKDVLGLPGGDYDDDGAGGSEPEERISAEQAKGLHSFMLDVQANWAQFKAHFNIENIAELPVSRYEEAMRELHKKLKKQESQNG